MQILPLLLPTLIGGFSTLRDATSLDPASTSACSLSDALGPFDKVQLYLTLDSAVNPMAVPTPPNLLPVAIVRGSDGTIGFQPPSLQGYPYFAVQRIAGTAAGNFLALGGNPVHGSSTPVLTPLPALQSFSAQLNLVSFVNGPVLVGLDANQTVDDVFLVYGTNDPFVTGLQGAVELGTIQGGGGLTGTTLLATGYSGILAIRTGAPQGGATAGNLIAYGPLG